MVKTRKTSGKKTAPLDGIQPEEAVGVLKNLLAIHPELVPEAEEIWRLSLEDVSFETIAVDVESAILLLDLDDLNDRAGSHSWGYLEPSEAALELLDEALAPFREEMLRKLALGMNAASFAACKLNSDRKWGASFDFGEFVDHCVPEWQWLARPAG